MSYFKRLSSSSVQYHTYSPDSISLQNIGLASYSRNSFADFGYKYTEAGKILDKDIEEYFSNGPPPNSLLGDDSTLYILHYDVQNDRYIAKSSKMDGADNLFYSASGNNGAGSKVASSLKDFQVKWDSLQKGFPAEAGLSDNDVVAINDVYANIKNSLSGCITFTSPVYSILGVDERTLVKIHFTATGKTSTSRKVAIRDIPTYVVTPKDNALQSYSYYETMSQPPGQSIGDKEGGVSNPDNTVAAQPKYRFDDVSGKIEFGTFQTLAILLADLPGVPTPPLPQDIDSSSPENYRLAEAETALALPLQSHNGNPKNLSPNSYDCGGFKKQKILITNVTPRSYEKGDLITANLINGIWIPMGYKEKIVSKPIKPEWSELQKYIVNAHSFFRNSQNTANISSTEYLEHFRTKYCQNLQNLQGIDPRIPVLNYYQINNESSKITKTNGKIEIKDNPTIQADENYMKRMTNKPVAYGYISVCDADQIHTSLGGNNTVGSFYKKNNLSRLSIEDSEAGITYAINAPFNWGMFFPEGYDSTSVSRLKNNQNSFVSSPSQKIYASGSQLSFSQGAFDLSDDKLYHFPAQMAIHGSDKPTIDYANYWYSVFSDLQSSYLNIMNFNVYKHFLKDSTGKDLFRLNPLSPHKMHFYPLHMELALSDFLPDATIETSPKSYNQNGYTTLWRQLKAGWIVSFPPDPSQTTTGYYLGNVWNRNNLEGPSKIVCRESDPKILSNIGFSTQNLVDVAKKKVVIRNDYSLPVGGPNLFPPADGAKEASNIVGVLAAKATVELKNGGQLTLSTENRFGARDYTITTIAGSNIASAIIGGIMSITQDLSGSNRTNTIKQWGSSNEGATNAFGTTALFCRVYDHCPNTVYDGRYFTPIQFNLPSLSFMEPSGNIGMKVTRTSIAMQPNSIRSNKLLSGGGFYYIKKYIGIDISDINITNPGEGYQDSKVRVKFGGKNGAEFLMKVSEGKIVKQDIEIITDGEFESSAFSNQFIGQISPENEGQQLLFNTAARIVVNTGTVKEKIALDPEPTNYGGDIQLTPSSNRGQGNARGIVNANSTKTVAVSANSTGKYDIFFFFVNDIHHTFLSFDEITARDTDYPAANYVKLEISAV